MLSFHDFFLVARFNLVGLIRISYLDPYSIPALMENQRCNFTSLVYAQNYGKIYLRCFLASKFLVKLLKVTGSESRSRISRMHSSGSALTKPGLDGVAKSCLYST